MCSCNMMKVPGCRMNIWPCAPKAKPRPKVRHDPRHGAMAADAGGNDGDGDRRGDEDPMRRRVH